MARERERTNRPKRTLSGRLSAYLHSSSKTTPPPGQDFKKVVIVGDGFCGKTSLLGRFCHHEFGEDYVPTVFDNEVASVFIDGREICLSLWDTAGQEAYDKLRPLSYTDADVVIVTYSVADRDTMTNVIEKWAIEIRQFLPRVPILLVGTKLDLRPPFPQSRDLRFVGKDEGQRLAGYIGADDFVECSALAGIGVSQVFHKAATLSLRERLKKPSINEKRQCNIF